MSPRNLPFGTLTFKQRFWREWSSLIQPFIGLLTISFGLFVAAILAGLLELTLTNDSESGWVRGLLYKLHKIGLRLDNDTWHWVHDAIEKSGVFIYYGWLILAFVISYIVATRWVMPQVPRYVPPDHPTCIECGYNLTGNVSGVCPECGTRMEAKKTDSEPQ